MHILIQHGSILKKNFLHITFVAVSSRSTTSGLPLDSPESTTFAASVRASSRPTSSVTSTNKSKPTHSKLKRNRFEDGLLTYQVCDGSVQVYRSLVNCIHTQFTFDSSSSTLYIRVNANEKVFIIR